MWKVNLIELLKAALASTDRISNLKQQRDDARREATEANARADEAIQERDEAKALAETLKDKLAQLEGTLDNSANA
jgi:uncharacterized coiled-coil DUF342 family protein